MARLEIAPSVFDIETHMLNATNGNFTHAPLSSARRQRGGNRHDEGESIAQAAATRDTDPHG